MVKNNVWNEFFIYFFSTVWRTDLFLMLNLESPHFLTGISEVYSFVGKVSGGNSLFGVILENKKRK
jgi:hypothetical protein